jgi:hypothetical protein
VRTPSKAPNRCLWRCLSNSVHWGMATSILENKKGVGGGPQMLLSFLSVDCILPVSVCIQCMSLMSCISLLMWYPIDTKHILSYCFSYIMSYLSVGWLYGQLIWCRNLCTCEYIIYIFLKIHQARLYTLGIHLLGPCILLCKKFSNSLGAPDRIGPIPKKLLACL